RPIHPYIDILNLGSAVAAGGVFGARTRHNARMQGVSARIGNYTAERYSLRPVKRVILVRKRNAGLAIDQQPVADDETGAGTCNCQPIDLARQTGRLHSHAGLRGHLASVNAGPHPFAFDTEHEDAGLCVDAGGAARQPPLHIELSGIGVCRIEEVGPRLVADAIPALRADISAGPVVSRRRPCRRETRVQLDSAEAVVDADFGQMDRGLLDFGIEANRRRDAGVRARAGKCRRPGPETNVIVFSLDRPIAAQCVFGTYAEHRAPAIIAGAQAFGADDTNVVDGGVERVRLVRKSEAPLGVDEPSICRQTGTSCERRETLDS